MTAVLERGLRLGSAVSEVDPAATRGAEHLLADPAYVRLVRWVFTARLVCLALAAPSAMVAMSQSPMATMALLLLTLSSLVFSRSRPIRVLIVHPFLASADIGITVWLLVSTPPGNPALLTVVCTALAAGLLYPRRALVVLLVPLVVASLGAPASFLTDSPHSWQGWFALVAGFPTLVVGVCLIGSVFRHNVASMIRARTEVREALAAVGAAEERSRLARDMHDSVGKSIHGIALAATALPLLVDTDPKLAREVAASLAASAERAAQEARELLLSLRVGQNDRPTVDVVTEILAGWQEETGVLARTVEVSSVDAGPVVTHQLAYALREILHNVAQHARADLVEVTLRGDAESIELVVVDDGVGFEHERAARRESLGHFGLRGLRERAEQVGGTVEITSDKGKGTTVRWTARRQPPD